MQEQAFEVSISRTYLVLLAEFGGKGDRREKRPESHKLLKIKLTGNGKRIQIFNLKYFQSIKKQGLTPGPLTLSSKVEGDKRHLI